MEKIVCPSQCPEEGAQDAPRGHTGSTRDGQEAEGARRRHRAPGLLWLPREGPEEVRISKFRIG